MLWSASGGRGVRGDDGGSLEMLRLHPARWIETLRTQDASSAELPVEVISDARRRVRAGAALALAAYTVFLVVELSGPLGGSRLERRIDLTHDALAILLGAALYAIASARRLDDRAVLRAALAAELLLSSLISIAVSWAGFLRTGHVPTLTWVVPLVILFPLLVPISPRRTIVVAALAASTMPLSIAVLSWTGRVSAGVSDLFASTVAAAVAVGIAVTSSRVVHGAARQVAVARRAGSYELVEPLGQGGMGEVWKARHQLLMRPAAVKRILPERLQGGSEARETVIQRFTREAQVTASLRSPHTVELFDFGVSEDGALYYAMELLDGINAEHFVYRFGPIEPRRAVHWLLQVCHSLSEAHGRGLVHRDIKPSNLYVCRYGRDVDFLKVLDFGLTRAVSTARDPRLTSPAAILGTPGYMAPEQIFGAEAEPRSDLYAVGCVAYWLVTGSRPFETDSPDLLRRHALEPPPRPSQRSPVPLAPRLESLILSCLAKEPGDRPRDADAMSDELGRCLEERSWSEKDARQWWEANGSTL
jgi:serine/threonine-protein kinase